MIQTEALIKTLENQYGETVKKITKLETVIQQDQATLNNTEKELNKKA